MIVNRPGDVMHKAQLLRLLTAIADDSILVSSLYFKGGTCAAMSGWLDRFSVDLDFDLSLAAKETVVRKHLRQCFIDLELVIDTENDTVVMFSVKYQAPPGVRNTLHVDAMGKADSYITYESRKLPEIDRVVTCQTKESMVTHKLIASMDRFAKHGRLAGRDIYDIHHFFLQGFPYVPAILKDRTGLSPAAFFRKLIVLFEHEVTQQLLDEDLNYVVPYAQFRKIRKTLKQETLMLLRQEVARMKK